MPWNPDDLPDASGRTFVVTGSTSGIGYFAAEQLAGAGAHVVLAARSAEKIEAARAAIIDRVPQASLGATILELGSLASVSRAAAELAALPRLDGVLLNGGSMAMSRSQTTVDGLPLLLGTHVVANFALIAGVLPALVRSASSSGSPGRVVHTSTGFVQRFGMRVDDLARVPRTGVGAYTKAKTITELFAFELDRRLRAARRPVASLVVRPGVGVDAKTPTRPGIHDATTLYRRNPFTPWAQGKDAAAWSAVRALLDPDAHGGDYFAPSGGNTGRPVRVAADPRTAEPEPGLADRVWTELEHLGGRTLRM